MSTVSRLYTAEDLFRMPEDARYELIRGELREMPPSPGAEHGNITARFTAPIMVFVLDNDLGECFAAETGFLIEQDPDTVIGPDFAFVAKERLPDRIPPAYLPLAPDLVLETRSPGDTKRMVEEKVAQWLEAGSRMVLVLEPKTRMLTVHRPDREPVALGSEDTFSGEDVLPGFALPMSRVFREAR